MQKCQPGCGRSPGILLSGILWSGKRDPEICNKIAVFTQRFGQLDIKVAETTIKKFFTK